jgi:hypothetical protein
MREWDMALTGRDTEPFVILLWVIAPGAASIMELPSPAPRNSGGNILI